MDVTSIQGLYGTTPVTSGATKVDAEKGFQSMLNSVMGLLEDTNSQIQTAHKEEVAFQKLSHENCLLVFVSMPYYTQTDCAVNGS